MRSFCVKNYIITKNVKNERKNHAETYLGRDEFERERKRDIFT